MGNHFTKSQDSEAGINIHVHLHIPKHVDEPLAKRPKLALEPQKFTEAIVEPIAVDDNRHDNRTEQEQNEDEFQENIPTVVYDSRTDAHNSRTPNVVHDNSTGHSEQRVGPGTSKGTNKNAEVVPCNTTPESGTN